MHYCNKSKLKLQTLYGNGTKALQTARMQIPSSDLFGGFRCRKLDEEDVSSLVKLGLQVQNSVANFFFLLTQIKRAFSRGLAHAQTFLLREKS